MTFYFLDTSAFVRTYALEPGSERVRNLVRSATATLSSARIIVCDLVLPESLSALTQLRGRGLLTRRTHAFAVEKVTTHLAEDESPFVTIHASGVMRLAGDLVLRHGLRGADAVHLAAAVAARDAAPAGIETWFVSTDAEQCRGALSEAFPVFRPDTNEKVKPPAPRPADAD